MVALSSLTQTATTQTGELNSFGPLSKSGTYLGYTILVFLIVTVIVIVLLVLLLYFFSCGEVVWTIKSKFALLRIIEDSLF